MSLEQFKSQLHSLIALDVPMSEVIDTLGGIDDMDSDMIDIIVQHLMKHHWYAIGGYKDDQILYPEQLLQIITKTTLSYSADCLYNWHRMYFTTPPTEQMRNKIKEAYFSRS